MKSNIRIFVILVLAYSSLSSCEKNTSRNYYISNDGNDGSDGLTPCKAWRTIEKVNSSKFVPGDSILFEAGGIWREKLIIQESGTKDKWIVYSRYGRGSNPKILGSRESGDWVHTGIDNIWKCYTSGGNPGRKNNSAEIFFQETDGSVSWGLFQDYTPSFNRLTREYDWTWKNNTIYIYSTKDPDLRYQGIEIPRLQSCIRMNNFNPEEYIEVNDIDLFFAKSIGLDCGQPTRNVSHLSLRNLHIGWIGTKGGASGYGVSVFHSNLLIEKCEINDCGRRGISYNLYSYPFLDKVYHILRMKGLIKESIIGNGIDHHNIVIRNNHFHDGQHTTSLDLAAMPRCAGSTIRDVYFYNNLIEEDTSIIIGKNGDHTSNQIFIQEGGARITKVYIYNNIFKNTTARHILTEGGDTIFIWHNTIFGFNQNGIPNPYGSICLNNTKMVDFRNNIIYLNLPSDIIDHGILMEYEESDFLARDYNLYFQVFTNKNFSGGHHGYYLMTDWDKYLCNNPAFDQNSPLPQDPLFKNLYGDLSLQEGSSAIAAGVTIESVKTDFRGNPINIPPDLGAIQFYSSPYKED